jgi:transglutaminase-like putative cysteine protease
MRPIAPHTAAAAALFALMPLRAGADDTPRSRTFDFTSTAVVKDLPPGAKRLDLWLPVPPSDAHQTVELLRVDSPYPFEYLTETEYGNRILHAWSDAPAAGAVTLRFRCTRREYRHLPGDTDGAGKPDLSSPPSNRLLQPDRLGVIDDAVIRLSREISAGRADPSAQSRAIYDYVLRKMVYDKSGTGWGRGDTRYACEAGRGNCTDFHALFISLARALKIPARFEIGFSIPPDTSEGPLAGYHCWARFWLPDFGWVPVDASEASRNRDKREYFYGAHDEHRVMFTAGRDIALPGMKGEPLNFFIHPYAEVDGKPHAGVDKAFAFQERNQGGR